MGIRERILARADLNDLRATRDITGLAAALNAEGKTTIGSRFVTSRAVMAGCADGIAILDKLDAAAVQNSAVKRAMQFLGQEAGLDIGDPFAQGMVGQLVALGVITAAQGDQLKALALVPLIVTQQQVAEAMYQPDGTEK